MRKVQTHDWYDQIKLLLEIITTICVVIGVAIQLPKIEQHLQNLQKVINLTVSEKLSINTAVSVCVTHANITKCTTCREYPIRELNATLRICDIITTDSITNTSNKTEEIKIIK
jgi:hypothetical protein